MKQWTSLLAGLTLLEMGVSAKCQGIDEAMRQADLRLQQPVTVSQQHIAVGELLQQFARQSGVTLQIDERDVSSGYDLLAQCDHQPLGVMLDALYSLLSSRGAEWKWIRQGNADKYSYRLVESTEAREKTERCRAICHTALVNYVILMRKLTALSPQERKKYKQQVSDALHFPSEEWTNGFFETEDFWIEAKMFFSVLTPDQQEKLLTGSTSYTFRADQLSIAQYKVFHDVYKCFGISQLEPDGTYKPLPEPKTFSFFVAQPDLPHAHNGATIYINYPDGSGGTLLGSGHLNGSIQRLLHQAWLLPHDQTSSSLELRVIPAKTSEPTTISQPAEAQVFASRMLYPHVMQMAGQTGIPVLAIFTSPAGDISAPADRKVEELLAPLRKGDFEVYKWRNGVLLLNNTAWFQEREPAVPAGWLSLLHEGPQNQMTLAGLVKFNANLNPMQLRWLGRARGLAGVEPLHLLLQYANEHPNAMTEAGSVVSVDDVRFFIALNYVWAGTPDTAPARIRSALIDTDDPEKKTPQVRVDIYDAKKQVWKTSATHELARPRTFYPEQAAMYNK